jgi:hypothetical protein
LRVENPVARRRRARVDACAIKKSIALVSAGEYSEVGLQTESLKMMAQGAETLQNCGLAATLPIENLLFLPWAVCLLSTNRAKLLKV